MATLLTYDRTHCAHPHTHHKRTRSCPCAAKLYVYTCQYTARAPFNLFESIFGASWMDRARCSQHHHPSSTTWCLCSAVCMFAEAPTQRTTINYTVRRGQILVGRALNVLSLFRQHSNVGYDLAQYTHGAVEQLAIEIYYAREPASERQ